MKQPESCLNLTTASKLSAQFVLKLLQFSGVMCVSVCVCVCVCVCVRACARVHVCVFGGAVRGGGGGGTSARVRVNIMCKYCLFSLLFDLNCL